MNQVIVLKEYKDWKSFESSLTSKRRINERIGQMLKQHRAASGKSIEAAACNFRLTQERYLACERGLASIKASDFAAGIRSYGFEAAFNALMLINEIQREYKSVKSKT